jgi:hypothetical protein
MGSRLLGFPTAIAVTILGRLESAVFATAYFLAQVPILLVAVVVFRCVWVVEGSNAAGAETNDHNARRAVDGSRMSLAQIAAMIGMVPRVAIPWRS